MNEVGAKENDKQKNDETAVVDIELHIGVFFDGTNNNANTNEWLDWFKPTSIVEKNHALKNSIQYGDVSKEEQLLKVPSKYRKNSNPAILSSLYYSKASSNSKDNNETKDKFLHVYIEGSGANGFQAENKIVEFIINGKAVKGLGFGVGPTGVVAKVSKAINYIGQRVEKEENNAFTKIKYIHFYVFGFSRGSACARLFSYIVARNAGDNVGKLKKEEGGLINRNAENEFDKYLSHKYFINGEVKFLCDYNGKMDVDFLGIYDTVSAIGFLKEENGHVNSLRYLFLTDTDFWDNFHKENVDCYGLFSPTLSHVKSTCHICALDEFRANFALTDVGAAVNNAENIELFIPGCHSDIGGGYTENDKVERKTLKFYDGKSPTRMCIHHPSNKNRIEWQKLLSNLDVLKKLGWVDNSCSEIGNIKEIEKGKADKVDIDHNPKQRNQYSNIPLRFMYERAKLKIPNFTTLFESYPSKIFPIPANATLNSMWVDLEKKVKDSGRHFYLIGGDYSSEKYKEIRQTFLHFTSTDTLHSFGDPGNPPGRRIEADNATGEMCSDICRLVYHGDKGDRAVHYMQDYGTD